MLQSAVNAFGSMVVATGLGADLSLKDLDIDYLTPYYQSNTINKTLSSKHG